MAEIKSGIGCGLVLALVVGVVLFALNGLTTAMDRAAMERAEYVRAQAEYAIAAAASRQMDAGTEAIRRDTDTAHGFMMTASPWVLAFTLGGALLAVLVGGMVIMLHELQQSRTREALLLAALEKVKAEAA